MIINCKNSGGYGNSHDDTKNPFLTWQYIREISFLVFERPDSGFLDPSI
jgi:hypothetical protein